MGTRADFYVGRGEDAEWLGSIAWDGYPDGISSEVRGASTETAFRHYLTRFFSTRDDVSLPEDGWPWPWETSHTTDFAYAFDGDQTYASDFGGPWFPAVLDEMPEDDDPRFVVPAVFPDMSAHKNVQLGGKRSGLIVVSMPEETT